MGRDDLYITIPSFFRCPISLDVMKSPVSLCTGVTYDRTSIQRWLDSGNNTCPATMQVLQTKDLVPNHTLQRLIQIWSESVKTRQPSPSPSPPASGASVVGGNSLSHAEVKAIIDQLKSNLLEEPPFRIAVSVQCINKLMFFAKQSDQNCSFLSGADSELLSIIISRFNAVSVNILLTEKLVQILHLLLKNYRGENQIIVVEEKLVASLIMVLRQGKMESKILVSSVLKVFVDLRAEYKQLLGENEDVYAELLKLMASSEWDSEAVENSLYCLLSISMPKKNRTKLVRGGAVGVLTKALCEGELKSSSVEKVLKLLEMVSTCKDGRGEICGDEKCVGAIVRKVLKVSTMATEHAVTILWSLCCLFRDQKALESVAKSNGLAKILLLLQSNVSPAARQMCSDLLKVFRVNSKNSSCLSSYDTKTTHIMPF